MTTGLEHASTEALVALRANLWAGMGVAAEHLERGTFDVAPSAKAVPPREAAHLTVGLFELFDFELANRGVDPLV